MVSKEREAELNELFWNESNDEETQEWRDELTIEEKGLIEKWDHNIMKGMSGLYKEILDNDIQKEISTEKQFTEDQMKIINKGYAYNLSAEQIDLFAQPVFTPDQMEQIRFAIMDGLTKEQIQLLAKPEMPSWQMDLCSYGMKNGLPYEVIQPLLFGDQDSWGEKRTIVEEKIEDLKKDKYNLAKSVQEAEKQKHEEQKHEEHYKAFATSKSSDKPTIIYGNSPEEILGKLQAWNNGRTEDNKFVTSNIGTLNIKNNEYENYHKFDVLSGKDITPLYLKLPHLKKAEFTKLTAELKQNGAKYNGFSKKWYVTRENDLNKFADYLDFTKESERQPRQMETKAEQKEIFKYYITQKAIDIGTYPIVGEESPTVTEYEQQHTVKFGDTTLQVLGHLEYMQPLSLDQMKEYGLRAADGKETHQEIKYRYGDKSYTKEQMDSINRGIGAKLSPEQIKLYARTELSSAQMEEIRFSILDGLSAEQISKFAKVNFKSWQMDLCRIGMQHGVTFRELQPVLAENDKTWTEKRNQLDKMIRDKDIKEKERVPENYLASAEMSTEQNYNSIDGVINNEAPKPEKDNKESSKVDSGKKGSIMSKLAENKESIREEANQSKTEPEKGKDGIRLSRE